MNRVPRKILVIEDDLSATRLVRYALKEEGYQVMTAQNGVEGLRKARQDGPDMVVLDVMLPGLDGFELCHRLRADPRTKELPVMILSGKVRESDRAVGLKVGADEYVTKPADPSDLARRVGEMLARKSAQKARVIGFVGCQPGVGTSSVAANVAVSLSLQEQHTVLVDLSTDRATIPALLGLDSERIVTKFFGASGDGVESHGLMATVTEHHSGLRVLSQIQETEGSPGAPPTEGLDTLFQGLREMADYVVLDVSGRPCELEESALQRCDAVVIVTGSDSGGLANAKSRVARLVETGLAQGQFVVVVIDRDNVLDDVQFSRMKRVVESMIQIPLLAIVPFDFKLPLEFEGRGVPVVLAEPNRPISLAIGQIAGRLISYQRTGSFERGTDEGEAA